MRLLSISNKKLPFLEYSNSTTLNLILTTSLRPTINFFKVHEVRNWKNKGFLVKLDRDTKWNYFKNFRIWTKDVNPSFDHFPGSVRQNPQKLYRKIHLVLIFYYGSGWTKVDITKWILLNSKIFVTTPLNLRSHK